MKIPPKKPHFFKPILPGSKNGIKIPVGFLKYLKGHNHIEHAVLRRAGKKWLVKQNCRRFEAGWDVFIEQNDLQLGDIVVFRHEGNMEFEVSIFDSSHCEREYAEYLHEEEEEVVVVEDGDGETATHDKPFGQSHFECTIRQYCLYKSFLHVPTKFAIANGLTNKKCGLIVRDERQRSWNLKLSNSNKTRVYIVDGWRKFVVDNSLKKGDRIMFEVVTNGETPIWKFQVVTDGETPVRKFQGIPSPYIDLSNKASSHAEVGTNKPFVRSHFECTIREYCFSRGHLYVPKQFAFANGLIGKKCDLIIRDERQRSWNLKLHYWRTEIYIKDGWHKFIVDNSLKKGDRIMFEVVTNGEMPIWKFQIVSEEETPLQKFQEEEDKEEEEEEEGETSKKFEFNEEEDKEEEEEEEGETSKKFEFNEEEDKEEEEGETSKKFEFNDKPNSCIMSSSKPSPCAEEADTYIPFGQSQFVLTVKSYCLRNGYLRLPKIFALANDLAKKRDLIIRDERQRSWNLKLSAYGSQVYVLGGWVEFRDENDLKVGDHIMFEVVTNGEKPIWKFHDKPNPGIKSSSKAFPHAEAAIHKPFELVYVLKADGMNSVMRIA